MISAKVVEDSQSPLGVRLTTLQLCYPRFIHSEFMTHRVFSRNASSSRAIPVKTMLAQVENNPAETVFWGKNEPGMQSFTQLDPQESRVASALWRSAARDASKWAKALQDMGVHKQFANRLLEPFQYISVIVTSTEWENFFELRDHKDAEPNIQALAQAIKAAMKLSEPRSVPVCYFYSGESHINWHLPYISQEERQEVPLNLLQKMSVARCARVSYLTHEGKKPSVEKDVELYERLVGARPIHASPTEHQATPLGSKTIWSKNFRGWQQFREMVEIHAKFE